MTSFVDDALTRASWVPPMLRLLRVDFQLVVLEQLHLPFRTGSTLRGFLKGAMRRRVCVTGLERCALCPVVERCAYGVIWERPPQPDLPDQNIQSALLPAPVEVPPYNRAESREDGSNYMPGDRVTFSYHLLGEGTAYLPWLIQGMREAAEAGIGRRRARVALQQVTVMGESGEPRVIYDRQEGLRPWETLDPFIVSPEWYVGPAHRVLVGMKTPVHLRKPRSKKMLATLDPGILTRRLCWRLRTLSIQLEDYDPSWWYEELIEQSRQVRLLHEDVEVASWRRWSDRHGRSVRMEGLVGHMIFDEVPPAVAQLWSLAEFVHVGRYTRHGLGRLVVERVTE